MSLQDLDLQTLIKNALGKEACSGEIKLLSQHKDMNNKLSTAPIDEQTFWILRYALSNQKALIKSRECDCQ